MKYIFLSTLCVFIIISSNSQNTKNQTTNNYQDKIKSMKSNDGFIKYYWEDKTGKIWLEIKDDFLDREFLYVNALSAGVGSNDIGLDRGQLGDGRIVKFIRSGPSLLLIQPNYDYRAISENVDEQKAVREAFAQSVLWGFTIEMNEKNNLLVDATAFLLRDAHGIAQSIKSAGQGNYSLSAKKSVIYLPNTKNFPKNTEFEAMLTFDGQPDGGYIRSVTPTPEHMTVRLHHSFIELPDDQYKPRLFNPASGFFGIRYKDYAVPIHQEIDQRYIARHRLAKKDPDAASSEAVDPIIYYLDRGAPEPIKSALLEGAGWWNQAFEAIGYKDAFQVKVLPDGVDPLDIRYNVIQWVHRSTRGWSYGSTVTDPRTGEIIKGHVTLGSLRVRQDYLIARGLKGYFSENGESIDDSLEAMALARLRQLSAHEVGHTLGLAHNFAASTNNRASVMDYPYPLILLDADQNIDLSQAYDDKIGAWDKLTIAYGYQEYENELEEKSGLQKNLQEAGNLGLRFISDQDARPAGGAHPYAHLWDNGANATDELYRLLEVRKKILGNFNLDKLKEREPLASLEEVLVPIYLMHRYQVEAAVKLVGGVEYTYAVKGVNEDKVVPVSGSEQRKALGALLFSINPEQLSVDQNILSIIPPKPLGYGRGRENFASRTGPTFDPMAAAESIVNQSLELLFHPARASRLVQQHSLNSDLPGLQEFISEIFSKTFKQPATTGYLGALQRQTNTLVLQQLMALTLNTNASSDVRAISLQNIIDLEQWIKTDNQNKSQNFVDQAAREYMLALIKGFKENKIEISQLNEARIPDGSPIGSYQPNTYFNNLCDF